MPFKNSTLKNNRIITAHMGDFFADSSYYASLRAVCITATIGLIYVNFFYSRSKEGNVCFIFRSKYCPVL